MTRLFWATLAGLALSACPGAGRPNAPAPEYEPPVVMPWDSGAPADPLEGVEGEEVTDDEPVESADAGPPIPSAEAGTDAAAP